MGERFSLADIDNNLMPLAKSVKPCPFCGAWAEAHRSVRNALHVKHRDDCYMESDLFHLHMGSALVDRWNRRHVVGRTG